MGASYVYKRFTTQDTAVTPFNAHKQYDFNSGSASEYSVDYYTSSYTSESVSVYSSASSNELGTFDPINNIKYNQLDFLYYRNYKKEPSRKKDHTNHNKQRRDLYEKANIISIPSGLFGYQIRKSTFYISSSKYELLDDTYGNLMVSGTDLSKYPNDVQENVFRLDPIKGFKKYDLSVFDGYAVYKDYYNTSGHQVSLLEGSNRPPHIEIVERLYWRQGLNNPNAPQTYTTNTNSKSRWLFNPYEDMDEDDSYFVNEIDYNNLNFRKTSLGSANHKFPTLHFSSNTSSFIKMDHDPKLNFNRDEEFAISFYIKPESTASNGNITGSERRYILAKSTTKSTPGSGLISGSFSNMIDTSAGPQFPFEIYMQSQSLYFARSDGKDTDTVSGVITASINETCQVRSQHILCQLSSSQMQIWLNGTKISSLEKTIAGSTRNNANLYIGSRGPTTEKDSHIQTNISGIKYFNGELGNINIWNRAYNADTIANISESVNASPYVGNVFYNTGLAAITHPKYTDVLGLKAGEGQLNRITFQGTHLIYEHEYQCNVQEHEFNGSLNPTVRVNTGPNPYALEDFTTGSFFQPFVTSIGLYNDAYELLAVAKLGQPVRRSDQTDMTFIVRWDT
tara:strand:- start:168 stop:2033 length:1866 start_codon:yes stop_codon:yes gene_type:complete